MVAESRNTKALKSGAWYTVSNILIRSIGIITTPIYTRMLSTSDYGIANIFTSWINILSIIVTLGLIYSLGRAKIDFPDKFDEFVSSIQTLSSCFTVLVIVFAFIFSNETSYVLELEKPLVYILFVYLFFSPSLDYMQNKYRYEYRYRENIALSVIISVSTVIFSIVLILLFPQNRYYGKIIGSVLPVFLIAVYFYIKIIKQGHMLINLRYWKYALKISLPMIIHGLSLVILVQMDRIMIMKYCGSSEAGIYSFAYSYATLLGIFTGAIGQAWIPWFNDQFHEKKFQSIRNVIKPIMLFVCLLSIGCILITPEALRILGPKSYLEAKWVVAPIVIGTLCQFFYTNYVNIELYLKRTVMIASTSIIAAVVNIILNIIFIPRYGYIAAGYTTLAGYLVLMLMHFFITRFIMKVKLYDDKYMFLCLLLTGILGIGICTIYAYAFIRYLLIIIVVALIFIFKRRDVIKFVKDFILSKFIKARKRDSGLL